MCLHLARYIADEDAAEEDEEVGVESAGKQTAGSGDAFSAGRLVDA